MPSDGYRTAEEAYTYAEYQRYRHERIEDLLHRQEGKYRIQHGEFFYHIAYSLIIYVINARVFFVVNALI